jgi:hypothetical protein
LPQHKKEASDLSDTKLSAIPATVAGFWYWAGEGANLNRFVFSDFTEISPTNFWAGKMHVYPRP